MNSGDHDDISVSKTLHFVQGSGLQAKRVHTRQMMVEALGVNRCLPFCNLVCSTLFYSILTGVTKL